MRRDQDIAQIRDADDRLAARLFASAGPLLPSEARKARVRAAVESAPASAPWQPLTVVIATAVIVAVVVALPLLRHAVEVRELPPPPPRSNSIAEPPPSIEIPPDIVSRPAPQSTGYEPAREQAIAPKRRPVRTAPHNTAPPDPPPSSPNAFSASPAPGDAPTPPIDDGHDLIMDAKGALQARDPALASTLAERYRTLHPHGLYDEEAQAIAIAAAGARRDPAARDLATRYLSQYPRGRFRELAEGIRRRYEPPGAGP